MIQLRHAACVTALLVFAAPALAENSAIISGEEIRRHVGYLASEALEGRGTGTKGERLAGEYLADQFNSYGLKPGAADGTFFQSFAVAGRSKLIGKPTLKIEVGPWYRDLEVRADFNPFGFSASFQGDLPLVFAGYGITDPKRSYDDYAGLDVKGKAVLILRHEPREKDGVGPHSTFTRKAENAKAHGALAVLIVTDPLNHPEDDTVLRFGGGTDAGIFVAHVRRSLALGLLELAGKDLLELQKAIDGDMKPRSFAFDARIKIRVKISRQRENARNVVAMLPGTDPKLADEVIVIGAHYDHLGRGGHGGSLAPGSTGEIHNGADDNASGTAGLLELAQAFAANPTRRTIYFVGFSGEERGLLGSAQFVKDSPIPTKSIAAMVNLDMIGRLTNDSIEVGGAGTAPNFESLILKATKAQGLDAKLSKSGFGPSDHASFYRAEIPVLFFFTGLHKDYHRPTDDADLINAKGAERVARAAYECARELAEADARPEYVKVARGRGRRGNRARLGVMLDSSHPGPGVKIAEVMAGSAAAKAGLLGGDIVLTLDGTDTRDTRALIGKLRSKKPGDEVVVEIDRQGKTLTLKIKLGSG